MSEPIISRKDFLKLSGLGLGTLAFKPVIDTLGKITKDSPLEEVRVFGNELIERRENLLPNNERYLDVVIPEKVFKRFLYINDGVKDFPTWYKKYQNARTNDLIRTGVPGLDLNIVIKRILVLADPLMENYSVQFDPTKDKWHHDNLGRLPLDLVLV